MITSQIEEDERLADQRRLEAVLLEKQEKNDKKKENEQFLDRLVITMKWFALFQCFIFHISFLRCPCILYNVLFRS